nr:HAMP domain-containing sensor histidine kinase [Desulfobacteraceae bacterium]
SSEGRKLTIIVDQTSRLESMIQDMLAFARPLVLRTAETELGTLAREGLAVAQETAVQQGVILRLQAEEGLWCQVDRSRFLHILLNVLINAIEASPAGEEVLIRLFRDNGFALLEVADRGPGIPPDQRQRIFEPFYTTKKNGTGLGLPIARKIIEAHGGLLEVADREGGGTVFRLKLPAEGTPTEKVG